MVCETLSRRGRRSYKKIKHYKPHVLIPCGNPALRALFAGLRDAIATRASLLQKIEHYKRHVLLPCGSPALRAMFGGLRDAIATRASLLQKLSTTNAMCFSPVGAPPSGRWVVVCEALSRRGRRSFKKALMRTSSGRIQSVGRLQLCSACHISMSRSAVQMRGFLMPLASS